MIKRGTLLLLALLIAAAILSLVLSRFALTVSHYELPRQGLTCPVRIVQLTDLHNSEFGTDNKRLAAKVAEQEPDLILITAHRRENLGEPMRNMFRAIRRVLHEHPDVKALYPIHMNPAVREVANQELKDCEQIRLIDPLEVIDFHNIMAKSFLILTDSGGIQEEAPSLGKPVLVMRDTTERPEGIEAGTLKLVGTKEETIYREFSRLLDDPQAYDAMAKAVNPYGDGFACKRIADILSEHFSER